MNKKIEPYKGIAAIYEEIRPTYPDKLIQDIISKTALKPGDTLLEIGAGTGKATIPFAEKDFKIHAIEIGEDMAEILRDKCSPYPNVSLDVIPFEEWNNSKNQNFDMIYSAQAFHWLDVNVKYRKCYELLKDSGFLVLFWYSTGEDILPETQRIEEKVEQIIKKYADHYVSPNTKPERRKHDGVFSQDERKSEIEASGLFRLTCKIEYTKEIKNNANQYLKAKKSVPAFASILDLLDENTIKRMDSEIIDLINKNGGYVNNLFNFTLYITQKKL